MQDHAPSPGVVQHQGTTHSIAMGGCAMEHAFLQCRRVAALHANVAAAACGAGF